MHRVCLNTYDYSHVIKFLALYKKNRRNIMLRFSTVDNTPITIKPCPNGGLYTGELFAGPWGNVPVVPDTVHMTTHTLKSASPPGAALSQFGNNQRPGNNGMRLDHSLVQRFGEKHAIYCTNPLSKKTPLEKCKSFDMWSPQYTTL